MSSQKRAVMYKILRRFVFTILILVPLLVAHGAKTHAVTLSLDPVTQTVNLGDPVLVDLKISGLGFFAAPSLRVFDVTVSFDRSLLSYSSAKFGIGLDHGVFGSDQRITPYSGFVNFLEISLEPVLDLITGQQDIFTLATLNFKAIASGTSSLMPIVSILLDPDNVEFSPTDVIGANVTITAPVPFPAPVTLPAAFPLFAGGLGLLSLLGWRRNRVASAAA